MKSKVILFLLLFCVTIMYAQQTLVTGTVISSEEKLPIAGANIIIQGSNRGTISDFDGGYQIYVSPGEKITYSYVGFATQTVTVTNQKTINIILAEEMASLGEVVVVGYGTQKKKEVTGAVSVVNTKDIEKLNPTRIEQALQGQVPGVNITSSSGSPGSALNINIRGVSTNGNNNPLILVDGNPIEDLSVINPNDIKSINILKDATAGIYGVRAANGVILIVTKSGIKNTKTKYNIDTYYGVQQTGRKLDLLGYKDYANIINEAYYNSTSHPLFSVGYDPRFTSVPQTGTDWQDEAFDLAPIMNINFNANGGTKKATYSIGLSYLNQDGIVGLNKSDYDRITASANLNYDITKKLKFSVTTLLTHANKNYLQEGGVGSVLYNAINIAPTQLVHDKNIEGGFTQADGLGNEIVNPIAQMQNSFDNGQTNKISSTIGLDYTIIDGLIVSAKYLSNYSTINGLTVNPMFDYGNSKNPNTDVSSMAERKDNYFDFTMDTYINYSKTFLKNHALTVLLGNSIYKTTGTFNGINGIDVTYNGTPINSFKNAVLTNAKETQNFYTEEQLAREENTFDARLLSYFARMQYNYKEKYLLSAVIRRDASSKFGPKNKVGYFPSFSAGWNISEENFLKNSSVIYGLKLRASYGTIGNDRIPDNKWVSLLNGGATYASADAANNPNPDDERIYGFAEGTLGNPEFKWEEQKTSNIGLDAQFFNNKLSISMDAYIKTTENLLLSPEISGLVGANSPGNYGGSAFRPTVNAGTVENKGFEFQINYNEVVSDNFQFNTSFNLSTINNNVLFVASENGFEQGGGFGITGQLTSRMEAGYPIGYFYGYETDGIFQSDSEVANSAVTNAYTSAGDLKFKDLSGPDGTPDGIIDEHDRTYIGDPIPDLTFGFNFGFTYKRLDFNSSLFGSVGNEMVRDYEHRDEPLANRGSYVLDSWSSTNTNSPNPKLSLIQTPSTSNFSDYYVEDASYVRIQNIQLGYTFKEDSLSRFGVKKLRLYLSANNLHTFTNYSGYDPSASSGSPIGAGVDKGFYPVAKTYLFGVNLKF
ncbi:SusC/RagA family TonB-linked outer membrane protein [Tamlana sp. I1]|uniref:SusC/RagA family TonB-linked outer membrane protein n=1 Tax=Tamlana sp. I1 TaxID=2762061 RepID=UPI00188E2343|nr:TonB-dependent receptor [Tamlana sp. I1]